MYIHTYYTILYHTIPYYTILYYTIPVDESWHGMVGEMAPGQAWLAASRCSPRTGFQMWFRAMT